jgi:SAM-dependent methyltransferase
VKPVQSDQGEFWDRRYREEGAVWGEGPSPTAQLLDPHLAPGARVFDVGFGYGRDLVFLGRKGCRVSGIELAGEGRRQAMRRLDREGVQPEELYQGRWEDLPFSPTPFDAAVCHRLIHLLVTPGASEAFADHLVHALRPNGLLALGGRSPLDFDPGAMAEVGDQVFEYRHRPGHRIRYWTEESFARAFGPTCDILHLSQAVEPESCLNPTPCRLTVMLARKKSVLPSPAPASSWEPQQ